MATANSTHDFFNDVAGQAWIELMADYGVPLTKVDPGWETQTDDPVLIGVIGFGGKGVRATCLLGAEGGLVEASCRVSGRPRDWIAELANQLIGRVKMKLVSHGLIVTMTTPLALSGVRVTPLPRSGGEPMAFASPRGHSLLWLEIETDEDLVLTPSRPLSVGPGDLVF